MCVTGWASVFVLFVANAMQLWGGGLTLQLSEMISGYIEQIKNGWRATCSATAVDGTDTFTR